MNYNKHKLLFILAIIGCSIPLSSKASPYDPNINDPLSDKLAQKMAYIAADLASSKKIDILDIATKLFNPKKILDFTFRNKDGEVPQWLARTDFLLNVQKGQKTSLEVETIQPLYQTNNSKRNTFFMQVRWSHRHSKDTVNLGVGYRRLLKNETWLLGANAFYDTTLQAYHKRLGLGLEAIGQFATLRANYYKRLSTTRTLKVISNVAIQERVLDGYDIGLELPLPKLPWAHVRFDHFKWIGDRLANVHGHTLRLDLNLCKYLRFEFGRSVDSSQDKNTRMFAKASVNFGVNPSYEFNAYDNFISDNFITKKNLHQHTLDKVKRHHDIVVERVYSGGSGVYIGRGT